MEAGDDFFGDQVHEPDGVTERESEREREISKLRRLHVATGFRDSADGEREQHLQSGFDVGFLAGARATAPAAFWMGVAAVLDARAQRDGLRASEEEQLRSVRIGLRNGLRRLQLDGQIGGVSEAKTACSAVAQVDSSFLLQTAATVVPDSVPAGRGNKT